MSPRAKLPEFVAEAPAAGLRWPVVVLAVLCAGVCIAAFTLYPVSNNDIWIHLKTGQYVVEHGWPPVTDPYSYTATDHPYIAHEWLAGVLFYASYSLAGTAGMIVLKSLIVAAACALLLLAARRLGARWAAVAPALAVGLYIAHARFLERPHVFSYLLTALLLWLLLGFRQTRRPVWLWCALAAQVLWANLHGGWVQGVALAAVFALGEVLAYARARWFGAARARALGGRDVVRLAAIVPGCLVATLVNPYGARLLRFPFELARLQFVQVANYEWQPPYLDTYNTSAMFLLYLLYIGALWAAWFLGRPAGASQQDTAARRRKLNIALACILGLGYAVLVYFWLEPGRVHWQPPALAGFLYSLFGLLVVHTLANFRSVDFSAAGVLALFLLLSIKHNRSVTDATLVLLPFVGASWSRLTEQRAGATPGDTQRTPWWVPGPTAQAVAASVVLLAVAVSVLTFGYYYDRRTPRRHWGFGITENMPVCATDFLKRNHVTGNAFVSYALAGMLIHEMSPAVKVNIDSRNDVYGDGPYRDYFAALAAPDGMRRFLDRYAVDFFMLAWTDRKAEVFDWLESTGQWAPVYYDERVFILVKRKLENEDFVKQHEFRYFRLVSGQTSRSVEDAPRVLGETERAIADCPTSALGYTYMAGALLLMQRYEECIGAGRRAVELSPRTRQALIYMAVASELLGRRDDAIALWERVLALAPRDARAAQELQRLRGL